MLEKIPLLKKATRYPIDVTIWQKRGNNVVRKKDRARFVKKREGKRFYYLKGTGNEIQIPLEKITGDKHVDLMQKQLGEFKPFTINLDDLEDDGLTFNTVDEDVRFWISNKLYEADIVHRTKEGWWDRHGTKVMAIAIPLVIFLGTGILFKMLAGDVSQIFKNSIVQGFREAAQRMGEGGF